MSVQLSSIEQMPRSVPIWRALMDDLCQPPPARVARVLGISRRSVQRYNATGHAPRHVCLAVFWLTTWGRSQVNTQAENDAMMMAQYVEGLRRRVTELEGQLEHLLRIGEFGAANQPQRDYVAAPLITREIGAEFGPLRPADAGNTGAPRPRPRAAPAAAPAAPGPGLEA